LDKDIEERKKWDELRLLLNSDYKYNNLWENAIVLFKNRLNRKFFNPVQTIINHQKLEGEGFAIVTVQCALIESLASFRTGEIYTMRRTKASPSYLYDGSKKMFVGFLNSAEIFKDNFWKLDKKGNSLINNPFNAEDFYTNVRCGLMHEARTKAEWNINATKYDSQKHKIFLEKSGTKIKIYRTILHYCLKDYAKSYLQDLREENKNGENLRRFFARKLDHIYDKSAEPNVFDWWIDK
jgi:hypothetical protein